MRFHCFARLIALMLTVAILFGASSLAEEGSPEPTVDVTVYKELINGSKDAEDEMHVYYLQVHLVLYNYLTIAPDGKFGDSTEEAVREFQAANGLPATGIADYYTQSLLYSGDATIVPAPAPAATVRLNGSDGDDIRAMQASLIRMGFLSGAADGVFGQATENAVKRFKTYLHNNDMDYVYLDPDTPEEVIEQPQPTRVLEAGEMPIVEDIPIDAAPTVIPYSPSGAVSDSLYAYITGAQFDIYRQTVSTGTNGDEALRVQTRLASLGYLYGGMDGAFGENTARALRYFQYRSGMEQTGVADYATQACLFSDSAAQSPEYVFPYKLVVDVSDQRVYAYQWTGTEYGDLVRTMICSTGTRANPTLIGTFQAYGPLSGEWYYFKKYDCYAKWAFGIVGGYLFHSVIYGSASDSSLQRGSVNNLGRRASHGCVRLKVEDASWIYHNCPYGITVVVRE